MPTRRKCHTQGRPWVWLLQIWGWPLEDSAGRFQASWCWRIWDWVPLCLNRLFQKLPSNMPSRSRVQPRDQWDPFCPLTLVLWWMGSFLGLHFLLWVLSVSALHTFPLLRTSDGLLDVRVFKSVLSPLTSIWDCGGLWSSWSLSLWYLV